MLAECPQGLEDAITVRSLASLPQPLHKPYGVVNAFEQDYARLGFEHGDDTRPSRRRIVSLAVGLWNSLAKVNLAVFYANCLPLDHLNIA